MIKRKFTGTGGSELDMDVLQKGTKPITVTWSESNRDELFACSQKMATNCRVIILSIQRVNDALSKQARPNKML